MQTIQIPGVSFPVPKLCLGCAYFGTRESKELSFAIMDYFFEHGGRFFNTAHLYGDGKSEACLGEWVRSRGVRDQVILTSKGARDATVPSGVSIHHDDLLQDVDESLMHSGLDYFDFYLMHADDPAVSVEEIVSTMEEIAKTGKIRHYGCSNWSVARQKEAAAYAKAHGMQGFVIDENEWNLARSNLTNCGMCKWMDESFIALHEEDGVCVGAYSPMANGIFSKYVCAGNFDEWEKWCDTRFNNPYNREIARRIKKLCEETGWTAAQIQLAWHFNQPYKFPSFAIAGASKLSQIEDSMQAENITLTPEMMAFLRPDHREYPDGIRVDD